MRTKFHSHRICKATPLRQTYRYRHNCFTKNEAHMARSTISATRVRTRCTSCYYIFALGEVHGSDYQGQPASQQFASHPCEPAVADTRSLQQKQRTAYRCDALAHGVLCPLKNERTEQIHKPIASTPMLRTPEMQMERVSPSPRAPRTL